MGREERARHTQTSRLKLITTVRIYGLLLLAIAIFAGYSILKSRVKSDVFRIVDLNAIGFLPHESWNKPENRKYDAYKIPPSKITAPRTKRALPVFRDGVRLQTGFDPNPKIKDDLLDRYTFFAHNEALGLMIPIPKGMDPNVWFAQHQYELRYSDPPPIKSGQFNVVMVIYDACRPDHLSCYGYFRRTSPQLDKIAAEGVVFQQAISQGGWTLEAVASLFTGLTPPAHGCKYVYKERAYLAEDLGTIAEAFREAGYTICLTTQQMLFMGHELGYEQGFDIANWGGIEDSLTFIRYQAGRPFFLLHYEVGPHHPYEPKGDFNIFIPEGQNAPVDPDKWRDRTKLRRSKKTAKDFEELKALYDGEILQHDHTVLLPLWRELKELGLLENTLFIFTSDHGEAFGEHPGHAETWHESTYEEVIRVPLIFWGPGLIASGLRVKEQVGLVDVYPTLADMLRVEIDNRVQGQSLLPLLKGETEGWEKKPYYSHMSSAGQYHAYRTNEWKIVVHSRTRENEVELYNLATDPTEQKNVVDQYPEIADKLVKGFNEFLKESLQIRQTLKVKRGKMSEERLKTLKSLGYID